MKKILRNLAPIAALALLFGTYLVLVTVKDYNLMFGLKNIINQSIVVAVVATGAVFIYTLGSFDISLGASVCVSALLCGMTYLATENLAIAFIVCIGVAVVVSLFNSVLASVFHLPVFVTTIAMLSVLNAVALMLIGINGTGESIKVPAQAVDALDNMGFKLAVLIIYFLLCLFVFNFTKIGRKQKMVGGNPVCARLTGISDNKMAIVAFVMAGLGVGLAAFLSMVYAPTLSKNTASSVGMDVIIAIVFGGMPVSGGARSRIQAAVIGAFSMTILSQILFVLNMNTGISQIVKSITFLLVVFVSTLNQRSKMLPR